VADSGLPQHIKLTILHLDLFRDVFGQRPRGMEKRLSYRQFVDFVDFQPVVDNEITSFWRHLLLIIADPTAIVYVERGNFKIL
jgi:hypothetical protein